MLKQYALGLFEISLFMRIGVSRFNHDFKHFLQSFIALGLTLPFTLISVPHLYWAKDDLRSSSLDVVTMLFGIKFFVSAALLVGFSYIICNVLHKGSLFLKYVTISNWVTLIPLLLYIPCLYVMSRGLQTYDVVYPFLIVFSVYGYAMGTFIAKHVLKIPWELAVFVGICSMAISEGCYKLLFFIANIV